MKKLRLCAGPFDGQHHVFYTRWRQLTLHGRAYRLDSLLLSPRIRRRCPLGTAFAVCRLRHPLRYVAATLGLFLPLLLRAAGPDVGPRSRSDEVRVQAQAFEKRGEWLEACRCY